MSSALNHKTSHTILNACIAAVWLVNGLVCKVLNVVPRHEQIVAKILGAVYSRQLTVAIGISEMAMALWVLSKYKPRSSALVQMALVAAMNVMEMALAPELLLWGRINGIFALMFIGVVYYNGFVLHAKTNLHN